MDAPYSEVLCLILTCFALQPELMLTGSNSDEQL